jgi:hypothetical protein
MSALKGGGAKRAKLYHSLFHEIQFPSGRQEGPGRNDPLPRAAHAAVDRVWIGVDDSFA